MHCAAWQSYGSKEIDDELDDDELELAAQSQSFSKTRRTRGAPAFKYFSAACFVVLQHL
jgi:hypothetical protein